jgi:Flp pilus assembly pilin Flp
VRTLIPLFLALLLMDIAFGSVVVSQVAGPVRSMFTEIQHALETQQP